MSRLSITLWIAACRPLPPVCHCAGAELALEPIRHPQRRNTSQENEEMSPAVLDAWVAVGEATRGRERRQRCAMRGAPAGQRGSPRPARPPEVGIEHARAPKRSPGACGQARLGDVAPPFPDPQSQRKEAWFRASPEEAPRNRLLAKPPLVDA